MIGKTDIEIFLKSPVTQKIIETLQASINNRADQFDPYHPDFDAASFGIQKGYEAGWRECIKAFLGQVNTLSRKLEKSEDEQHAVDTLHYRNSILGDWKR